MKALTRNQLLKVLEEGGCYSALSTKEDGLQGLTIHQGGRKATVRRGYFYYNKEAERLEKEIKTALPGVKILLSKRNDHNWPKQSFASVRFFIPMQS